MKLTLFCFLLLALNSAFAFHPYYPIEFTSENSRHAIKDEALINNLFDILTLNHQKDPNGGADKLGCNQVGIHNCYGHTILGYDGARRAMFGKMHLKNEGNGYYIVDVYCNKRFGSSAGVGPGSIPNGIKINCEHTWPQSKFSKKFSEDMQKSDIHHLFPSDSHANSVRGNEEFTDVSSNSGDLDENCTSSKYGTSSTHGGDGFEPPLKHKGNVARALFYFSVRYKMSLSKAQEDTLRRWNDLDPVDQDEMNRNDAIYQLQGNRNPFIDFPNLVHDISKF